jgi:ferric-dicitrate binding protein FerR (iron transport regulator)
MLSDGSKVILDERSKLKILGKSDLAHEEGKVYYHIKKRGSKGLKVSTKFAIIGVKGTKFIINAEEGSQGVSLKEGLVGIDSLQGEFELHKKKEMDEFAAYQAKINGEFESYKKALQEEFVTYVSSFDLKPGKSVRFSKNRVDESEDLEKIIKDFSAFENFE